MRYVIFIAYEPYDFDTLPEDVQAGYYRDHAAFSAYVAEHGSEVASAALADADQATTVRRRGDDMRVTDGPFTESAEQIVGFYLIESDHEADLRAACERFSSRGELIEFRKMAEG